MDEREIQYQLGQLTAQYESISGWLEDVSAKLDTNTQAVAELSKSVGRVCERVKGLPCESRLEACRREMSQLRQVINGRTEEGRAISARRWGVAGAIIAALAMGIVEIIARIVWH